MARRLGSGSDELESNSSGVFPRRTSGDTLPPSSSPPVLSSSSDSELQLPDQRDANDSKRSIPSRAASLSSCMNSTGGSSTTSNYYRRLCVTVVALLFCVSMITLSPRLSLSGKLSTNSFVRGGETSSRVLQLTEEAITAQDASSSNGTSLSISTHVVVPACKFSQYTEEQLKEMPISRAIVIFFPVDQVDNYLPELKWFIQSWVEMMKHEPPSWRTDLIVFAEDVNSTELVSLGCRPEKRKNMEQEPLCISYRYTKVKNRPLESAKDPFSKKLIQQLSEYGYADSVIPLAEQPEVYKDYDWVLRSDIDTFLTHSFGAFLTPNCSFICGRGGYSTSWNSVHFARIAKSYGLDYDTTTGNFGSTWYGPGHLVAQVAQKTIFWMVELSENEFTPKMREESWWKKAELWPDWHYGVLLLYGGHMAIQEVFFAGDLPSSSLTVTRTLFDFPTSATDLANSPEHVHLHAWQNGHYFSKYVFKRGGYDGNATLAAMVENHNDSTINCQDYSLVVALQSKQLTLEGMRAQVASSKQ